MFDLTTDIQKAFFDSDAIERKVDAESRRNLSRAGASVRRQQIRSIKRRKSTSQPGAPPNLHSRNRYASPKNILFGYDERTKSVAIGMVRIPESTVVGDVPFPEAMEVGGEIVVRKKGGKARRVKIRRRPSAVPAAQQAANAGDLVEPWEGSILE